MMNKTISLPSLYHYLIAFCALLIGAYSKIVLVGILPLFFTILWGWKKGEFTFKFEKEQWGWILLYLIYATYSVFYWDIHLSPRQIEYKLAWVIFPLIFSFKPRFEIKKQYILYGLVLGIFTASILGIVKATQMVIQNGFSMGSISSSNICINHPTYFSAGALVLLMMILLEWKDGGLKKWSNSVIIASVSFILLMILLSYSMASFLFLALLSTIIWFYFFARKSVSWKRFAFFIGVPIAIIAIISQIRFVQEEFSNTSRALNKYLENPTAFIQEKNQEQNGDEIRLIMWTASFQECTQHLMGVGPTQIGHHLSDRLVSFHQNKIAEKNAFGEVHYNPHNQFLQMALEVGILPLLFFIALLIGIFSMGIKTKGYILCGLVLLLSFQCLFESMLQRQTGIVTFTFFLSYFVFYYSIKTKKDPSSFHKNLS
jgi:O-antigen ligase